MSLDDVRSAKATGMDLARLIVARSMPVIFTLLLSPKVIYDLTLPYRHLPHVEDFSHICWYVETSGGFQSHPVAPSDCSKIHRTLIKPRYHILSWANLSRLLKYSSACRLLFPSHQYLSVEVRLSVLWHKHFTPTCHVWHTFKPDAEWLGMLSKLNPQG